MIKDGTELKAILQPYVVARYAEYKRYWLYLMTAVIIFIMDVIFEEYFVFLNSIQNIFLVITIIVTILIIVLYGDYDVFRIIKILTNRYIKIIYLLFNNDFKCVFKYVKAKETDEKGVLIDFYVPASKISLIHDLNHTEAIKKEIAYIITKLIPNFICNEKWIQIKPLLPVFENLEGKTLITDLDKIIAQDLYSNLQMLPNEIKEKGEIMSEAYLYIYCIENSLRLFITKIAIQKWGNNYLGADKLVITNKLQRKIDDRKSNEAINKWLPVRGSDPLFYFDFKELSDLIIQENNWNDLFKNYFPSQNWLGIKMEEMGNVRNLIAHNSFIGEHERDLLRINYHSILKQINNK